MKVTLSSIFACVALVLLAGQSDGRTTSTTSTVCGTNEYYEGTCGTKCPTTCQNKDFGLLCIDVCTTGCFCNTGFIREYANRTGTGPCILPNAC